MTGIEIVIGPCWLCRKLFEFHPDLVTSVPIDPVTGLAPDLGGDPARAYRMPLCPPCCKAANVERRRRGLEPLDEADSLDVARRML